MMLELNKVGFGGFTAESYARARGIVRAVLRAYDGTALESMAVQATRMVPSDPYHVEGIQNARFSLAGDWKIIMFRNGGPYDWSVQQFCPHCNGGSRFQHVNQKPYSSETVLCCGGCGLALARPETGVYESFTPLRPSTFPLDAVSTQFDHHTGDPLGAILEAASLMSLCMRLATASVDLEYWSAPAQLAELMAKTENFSSPPSRVNQS